MKMMMAAFAATVLLTIGASVVLPVISGTSAASQSSNSVRLDDR